MSQRAKNQRPGQNLVIWRHHYVGGTQIQKTKDEGKEGEGIYTPMTESQEVGCSEPWPPYQEQNGPALRASAGPQIVCCLSARR